MDIKKVKQSALSSDIEKKELTIGFMPLTDCAPLIVAKELGYFAKFGLNVKLSKQNSWSSMRDKLAANVLDAGQLLAPMPLAGAYGFDNQCHDFVAPFILSRNGNAITFSKNLHNKINHSLGFQQPLDASYLRSIVSQLKATRKKLTFATVYPHSCHYLQLVSYFDQGGIDKDDIRIIILPPESMVAALRNNEIDGFCVGGPYNAKAVREGIGVTIATSIDIWPNLPEKVLGFKQQWYKQNPNTTNALICALALACRWLDNVPNRFEAAKLLSHKEYINTSIDVIAPSLLGSCLTCKGEMPRLIDEYNSFSSNDSDNANRPVLNEIKQLQRYFNLALDNIETNVETNVETTFTNLTNIDLNRIYDASIYDQAMLWHAIHSQQRIDTNDNCKFNNAPIKVGNDRF